MILTYCSLVTPGRQRRNRGVVVLVGDLSAAEAAVKIAGEMRLLNPDEGYMVEILALQIDTDDAPEEFKAALESPTNHNRLIVTRDAAKLFGAKYDPKQEPN